MDAEVAAARALADRHTRRDRARPSSTRWPPRRSSSPRCGSGATRDGAPSRCGTSSRPPGGARWSPNRPPRAPRPRRGLDRRRGGAERRCSPRAGAPRRGGRLRALLPEVERAAGLARGATRARPSDRRAHRPLQRRGRGSGRWPSRIAEHEALVAGRRTPMSGSPDCAPAGRRPRRARRRAGGGTARGAAGEHPAGGGGAAGALGRRPRAVADPAGAAAGRDGGRTRGGAGAGAGCPVCGATEHPRPAQHAGPR